MCDEHTLKDWEEYLKNKPVSRRKFTRLTAGVGLGAAFPGMATTQRLTSGPVDVLTHDGVADCYMSHPPSGSYPAVLIWPDVLGLRPAFMDMGRRLAGYGYTVLVANPYYRDARAPVVKAGASFSDQAVRDTVIPLANKLSPETHFTDARAFIDFLERHDAVAHDRKMATIGYCMGGPMVMRTAAARPDVIGAAASFHGGGLATTADNSPHLLIPDMKADFLVAIAENDDMSDPQAKTTLRDSFQAAGLNAEIEVYDGAQHGWTVFDSTVYDQDLAERAWNRLLALLKEATA